MKYKDFKMMSKDEMKEIKGGNVPAGGTQYCGTCTHMQGTPFQQSNIVCTTMPAGGSCIDMEGYVNMALVCSNGTPGGSAFSINCSTTIS